jgi:catechol 2,3-dioxygenase-like lactoylglutathione lyase family enzyme
MSIQRIHHVAYRCRDAKQTVQWYREHLGMDFVLAIAEDQVPSTHAPDPMGRDANTPEWVQHIAFKVGSIEELEATKAKLQAAGIEVIGPTDHTIFKSIYFFDPNGHRVELAADTATAEMNAKLDAVKWDMLDEWAQTRRAPKHAAWMHEKEFKA